jgi:Fe-S oxidoreductase
MSGVTLDQFLCDETSGILDACTRCGECVRVCPVVPYISAKQEEPQAVVGGILDMLRDPGTDLPQGSADWLNACNGCGLCIEACPENVNPRKMLMVAGTRQSERETRTPELFKKMSRAIKIMVAMQVVPEEFKRLLVPSRTTNPDVVFYTGCNALRTPHLLFNTMYVLDALDVSYDVVGGPSSCCGVIAAKWEGKLTTGQKMSENAVKRFGSSQAEKILNWCPTCALHLRESLDGFLNADLQFDHVTDFIADEVRKRSSLFTTPIQKRVVLHGHAGSLQITQNVEAILKSIPGLEVVETVMESSYTCGGSGCSKTPELAAYEHAHLIQRTQDHNADALVTLFHGCHSIFLKECIGRDFEVLNFTDLIVEAMGEMPHKDALKGFRFLNDWELIVDEAAPLLAANGLALDREWLIGLAPQLFSSAEFKGGLECFSGASTEAV